MFQNVPSNGEKGDQQQDQWEGTRRQEKVCVVPNECVHYVVADLPTLIIKRQVYCMHMKVSL